MLQLTGILSVGVNITNALAIRSLGVFLAEVIYALSPILIYLIAIIIKTEKLTLRRSLGIFITISGVILAALL